MNIQLRIVLLIAVCVYFFSIFYFLRKKSLALKYTLLWLFWGLMMLVVLVFPGLLDIAVGWLGIYSPVNGIFAVVLFGVLVILISLTSIVSKQSEKIRILIQYNAELEKRVRDLEGDR